MSHFLITALFVLFTALSLQAKTLVVTDIDDTIKTTYVKAPFYEKQIPAINAFYSKNYFYGSAEIFQLLASQNQDILFYYVSGSPQNLSKQYQEFLTNSGFPAGQLIQKPSGIDVGDFKVQAIAEIIDQNKPDTLILLGDNGQKDPEVFEALTTIYANNRGIKIKSFVHYVYKDEMSRFKNMSPYVVYTEVAIELFEMKLLTQESLISLTSDIYAKMSTEKREKLTNSPQVIPEWMRIKGYAWRYSNYSDLSPTMLQTKQWIEAIDDEELEDHLELDHQESH